MKLLVFAKDWNFDQYGNPDFANKIRTALQHGDVAPGTEAAWVTAISSIERESALRLANTVRSAVNKAETLQEMSSVLQAYPQMAREIELAIKSKQLRIYDGSEPKWIQAIDDFMVSPEGIAAKEQAAFVDTLLRSSYSYWRRIEIGNSIRSQSDDVER